LISTHILSEVEMTCSRVLILHDKKIIMADAPDNLQQLMSRGGQVIAEIAAPVPDLQACWEQVPEIQHFDLSPAEGTMFGAR